MRGFRYFLSQGKKYFREIALACINDSFASLGS